jgi:acetyl-CoA synthetase
VGGVITNHELFETHTQVWRNLPDLRKIYVVAGDGPDGDEVFLDNAVAKGSAEFTSVGTMLDDPALLAFTSGSEGRPKGVLHAHRVVVGGLPAMHFSGIPTSYDVVWSHFDWGWLGGLLVPLVNWHCGAAVLVHHQTVLNPVSTLDLLSQFNVSRISVAPTALRMLRHVGSGQELPRLNSITAGGEKLDGEIRDWVRETFGTELCELYGLSECGAVLGSGGILPVKGGSIGKPPPGQTVRVIDEGGNTLEDGTAGQIAVQSPHPQLFLGYWRDKRSTDERFIGASFVTGDTGYRDDDGYFWYTGRADDLINVAGHRVGPGEIEEAFASCAPVQACAAAGLPDSVAGQKVVLYVELNHGWLPSVETEQLILSLARSRLQSHQIPRHIQFIEKIPRTATGKVHRQVVRELHRKKPLKQPLP